MKKHSCPIPQCSKTYRSRFTLRRHLEAFHYRTKRFSCQQCDKSFAYRHTLRKHIGRVHITPIIISLSTTEIPLLTALLRFCLDPEFKPACALPGPTSKTTPVKTAVGKADSLE